MAASFTAAKLSSLSTTTMRIVASNSPRRSTSTRSTPLFRSMAVMARTPRIPESIFFEDNSVMMNSGRGKPTALFNVMNSTTTVSGSSIEGINKSNSTILEGSDSGPSFGEEFMSFLIACYTLSCILAVLGNILCIFVFMEQRRTSQSEIYNYLINLAICDLLMAIFCIPFTAVNLLYKWILPELFCNVVLFFQMCFVSASIGTNICVSLFRLKGILRPLDRTTHTYLVRLSLVIVWVMSGLISLMNFKIGGVDNEKCGEINVPPEYQKLWSFCVATMMLFLPMTVIISVYCYTGFLLYRPDEVQLNTNQRSDDRRKITVTLFCVALCFCFSWTPLHLFFISLDNFPSLASDYPGPLQYIYAFSHLLAMSHSFHNPIVYICSSKHFRDTMMTIFKGRERTRRDNATSVMIRRSAEDRRSCAASAKIKDSCLLDSNHKTIKQKTSVNSC